MENLTSWNSRKLFSNEIEVRCSRLPSERLDRVLFVDYCEYLIILCKHRILKDTCGSYG